MDAHDRKVALIASKVRHFYDRKEAYRIYHGSTNSTRTSNRHSNRVVDTSQLTEVLDVRVEAKTALVEANVPMDRLLEATLPYGLVPPVIMEFPGITVGGGFAGSAGESSSFRYGLFDRTVNWIEMVLANGEIVQASATRLSDLFHGAASSFGTLGVTTLLELQLVEAKTFVELTYHPVSGISEALKKIEQATEDRSNDYLDGILFSKTRGVICAGRLTNTPSTGAKTQQFARAQDPWFYLHVDRVMRGRSEPVTEAVPLVDYLFRYDRGGFWVGIYAYRYFITPFNRVTRYLLDQFMHARVMYHALHRSGFANKYIIQDVAIPYDGAVEFAEYLDHDFTHYPLWICPLKQTGTSGGSSHSLMSSKPVPYAPEMLLNFGVWGPGPRGRQAVIDLNRRLEHKVHALGGRKWLYAQAYHTEEEFWDIYDREEYDVLREKYHASHLPTVFDKVSIDLDAERQATQSSWAAWLHAQFWSIWPLSGVWGVLSALRGRDYLLPRTKPPSKISKDE